MPRAFIDLFYPLDAPQIQANETSAIVASVASEMQQPQQAPIIIQMAPPTNYVQPIPTVIQAAPIRSMGAPMTILPPPNKLPLPRTYTPAHCSTGLVNVYNSPVIASQPWRLPKVGFFRTIFGLFLSAQFSIYYCVK